MVRPLRIQFEEAIYHVYARGNEKAPIFSDDKDLFRFLDLLSELPEKFHAVMHAYTLMTNHYHLIVETRDANLSKIIHYLNGCYSGYYNRKYQRVGHLFQGRYAASLIQKESYLIAASRYVHRNPIQAGMVTKLQDYPWSSYPAYIAFNPKDAWLTCDSILSQFSLESSNAIEAYREYVEDNSVDDELFDDLRTIIFGDNAFKERIKQMNIAINREIPESREFFHEISFKAIISEMQKRFLLSDNELRNGCGSSYMARGICFYLLKKYTQLRNEDIGEYFSVGYAAVSITKLRLA